jgi:hypothetical protein
MEDTSKKLSALAAEKLKPALTLETNVNYYSGENVKDLIPSEIPEKQEGVQLEDSNYSTELYSDSQLKKHAESDMNVFTVDGIPSRWEHNKLHSTWHFDTKGDPQEDTLTIMCKFKGDWQAGIEKALSEAKEFTIGNYRKRNMSQQDKELHDGELMDVQRASGMDDVSCMYHHTLVVLKDIGPDGELIWKKDKSPEYEVFFRMFDAIGLQVHQSRIHIQRLGQVTPIHIDQQMRYARANWRKLWTDAGADKNPLKLRRIMISLVPYDFGHVWQFGNTYYQGYDAGECLTYDWCNMPHGTANFGFSPRITLQATGFITEKTEWLIANGSKDYIIEV